MHVTHFPADNAILITSKNKTGLFGTFFYSNGDVAKNPADGNKVVDQEKALGWSDARHLTQALVGYRSGPLTTGLIYSYDKPVRYDGNVKRENERHLHLTASWKFEDFTLSGTYYHAENTRSAFATQATDYFGALSSMSDGAVKGAVNKSEKGFEIDSLYVGAAIPVGRDFLGLSAGFGKAEWQGNAVKDVSQDDGTMFRFGGVYRHTLSKRTYLYGAAAYLDGKDLLEAVSGHIVAGGLVHKF